ncbi:class I SAM-dependent methyltransferase [Paraclostridium sordellii]|uniref:class I SAM-dependent DNA methyltransferase n=1 Tax=Paraclostridium sordellii TaxID=1505 RepID=UPI0030CD5BA7
MKKKKTRIYGENVNINKNKVKLFWNKRAEKYSEENPYKAVKCNDSNSDYASLLDEYEKEKILPKLGINKNSKVLDIGCGIGRLGEIISPKCNYYLGTDFANDLLDIARERMASKENCEFDVCDFINLCENEIVNQNGPFDTVLLAGVAMYINDEELKNGLKKILKILDKKATIYICQPIATKSRLTLEEFYSKELNTEYNVIYRTIDECINIFKDLIDDGFELVENERFLTEIKQYSDTERHYFILRRN